MVKEVVTAVAAADNTTITAVPLEGIAIARLEVLGRVSDGKHSAILAADNCKTKLDQHHETIL